MKFKVTPSETPSFVKLQPPESFGEMPVAEIHAG